MAHSGGGGSSSGGSHGGGFSGGSGGDIGPVRGQSTYYKGANRYVYYYHGRSHIYYSDSPLREEDYRQNGVVYFVLGLIGAIFMLALNIGMIWGSSTSGKLSLDYNSQIYIDDRAYLIEDRDKLIEDLEGFRDKTGVSVAVVTDTYYHGDDLMQVALDEYYRLFEDESHWLIYYVGSDKARGDEWAWELICGDDCIKVLDYDQEDRFTEKFHTNLKYTDDSFDEALINSIEYLEPKTGWHLYGGDEEAYIAMAIMVLLGVWLAIGGARRAWGSIPPKHEAKMKAKATAKPQGELEYVKCPNCGGAKVKGTASKCPYCGSSYRKVEEQ